MTGLAGKHAVVTGGGTGVGAAIARALVAAGATVTVTGRREQPLRALAATVPGLDWVSADSTDEAAVEALFATVRQRHGRADIVVANAGAAESRPFGKTSLELWSRMLTVNLTGSFLTCRAALPDMQAAGWGRLVMVASTAGLKGYPYVSAYVAAKHGVVGLTRALAQETVRSGVTVNAVCPGFTETPLLAEAVQTIVRKTGRTEADARAELAASNPMGRFVQPEEVAATVLWLCSDGAAAVTGQALSVSGGEI